MFKNLSYYIINLHKPVINLMQMKYKGGLQPCPQAFSLHSSNEISREKPWDEVTLASVDKTVNNFLLLWIKCKSEYPVNQPCDRTTS